MTRTRTSVSQQTRTEQFDSNGDGTLDSSRSVVVQTTTTETYQEYVPEPSTQGIDLGEGAIRNLTTQRQTDTFVDTDRNGVVSSNDVLLSSLVVRQRPIVTVARAPGEKSSALGGFPRGFFLR